MTCFASALTAVTAIAVTRAAFAALTGLLRGRAKVLRGLSLLPFHRDHIRPCNRRIVGRVWLAALTATFSTTLTATLTALATFTAAFTTTFTTFTSAFTGTIPGPIPGPIPPRCAFVARFAAIGIERVGRVFQALVSGVSAAFTAQLAAAIAAAITGLAIACGAFRAFTAFGSFAARWTGLAFAQFAAAFRAPTTRVAGGADVTRGRIAALASAAITATISATTATITTLTITATFAAVRAALTVAAFVGLVIFLAHSRGRGGCGRFAKQVFQPAKKAARGSGRAHGHRRCCGFLHCFGGRRWGGRFGFHRGHRCRRIRQHAFDDGCLLVGGLLRTARHGGGVFHHLGHFVTRFDAVQARVVVLQALQFVMRCFQRFIGHQQHIDALLQFDLGDLGAFFVQQERGHFHRHLGVHGGTVVLHGLFLDDAQNLQCRAFGIANVASATAAWTGDRSALAQSGLEALAAHFHQAELADGAKLHSGTVLAQGIAQTVFDFAAVFRLVHVDEVDHDQATQIAQAHLACHFVGGFQVGAGGGFFDVAAFDGARRVHVHRNQSFGVVDHDGTARRQLHGAGIGRFNLVLNLEAAEQRRVIAVAFDAVRKLGHHVAHELLSLVVDVVGVDQDVADVVVEVIADGTNDQTRFLVDQKRAFAAFGSPIDGRPQLEQVVQVPLQLGSRAANARSPGDDGHALGVFQLVHGFFELGPVVTLDAAADATATGVVGHQHHIAARQTHKGGERCAFVAAFFFFHLNQQGLALADHVLDACLADGDTFSEILA